MVQRQEILIVDDIPSNRDLLQRTLEPQGYDIIAVPSGEVGLNIARQTHPDLILLDIILPAGMDGFETCRRLKADQSTQDIPVIFITAKDDEIAIEEGFEAGAVDYITKPFREKEVRLRVGTHLRISHLTQSLRQQNRALEAEIARRQHAEHERNAAVDARQRSDERLQHLSHQEHKRWGIAGFISQSPTITKILNDVRRLQDTGTTSVLITGESGTGKELIARAIHFGGPRAKAPFIPINCSAIPTELAESTFFGHVRGAFTGANTSRQGCFELAHGGTLFLDEIGDMPFPLQAKLLRVLEDGCVTPIGSSRQRRIDVRILAATNADLHPKIASGAFRSDLYFRLARFTVDVPPLRARQEDIPLLAQHFLHTFATEMGRKHARLSQEAFDQLQAYDYPGNIRELKNIIERAMIESEGAMIEPEHLHFITRSPTRVPPAAATLSPSLVREIPCRPPAEEDRVLAYVQQNGSINNAECRVFLEVDRHRAFYLLEKMQHEQLLVRKGVRRAARYYLAADDSAEVR
jgi:DNA-binding NtrC family response regulator